MQQITVLLILILDLLPVWFPSSARWWYKLPMESSTCENWRLQCCIKVNCYWWLFYFIKCFSLVWGVSTLNKTKSNSWSEQTLREVIQVAKWKYKLNDTIVKVKDWALNMENAIHDVVVRVKLNPLTPKIWLLILTSICYTSPCTCRLMMRICCGIKITTPPLSILVNCLLDNVRILLIEEKQYVNLFLELQS